MSASLIALLVLLGAGPAQSSAQSSAQNPAHGSAQDPAPSSDWHPFSRSSSTVYLADVAGMAMVDGALRVHVARVPRNLPAADLTHGVDVYAFRCGAKQLRFVETLEYGPDGAEIDRYEEDVEWERVVEESNYGFLFEMVCNEKRSSQGSFPSIRAFIAQGR